MTCPNCGATFTVDSLTAVKAKALRPEKVKPEPVDIEDLPEIEADDDVIEADDDLDDEILEDEEDNVDLEDIADVAPNEEEELRAPRAIILPLSCRGHNPKDGRAVPPAPGAIAQLGERLHGMQEVRGSIPLGSTIIPERLNAGRLNCRGLAP